jgi:hypothetical protein
MLLYCLTLVVALVLTSLSLGELLAPGSFYPTQELRQSFLPNDAVNLFVGLPILLLSLALARCGKLIGLLFWPGALFYITYNAVAYAIALKDSILFFPNLALVVLSIMVIILSLTHINAEAVRQQLSGAVWERLSGGVLVTFGVLFFLMAASKVVGALTGQAPLTWPELSMQFTDLLITPAWMVGGVFLWRKRAFGYVVGAGLLFQASMLFIGLLAFFILNAFITTVPFPWVDFLVVFMMGLLCFIPFGLFIRGVLNWRRLV